MISRIQSKKNSDYASVSSHLIMLRYPDTRLPDCFEIRTKNLSGFRIISPSFMLPLVQFLIRLPVFFLKSFTALWISIRGSSPGLAVKQTTHDQKVLGSNPARVEKLCYHSLLDKRCRNLISSSKQKPTIIYHDWYTLACRLTLDIQQSLMVGRKIKQSKQCCSLLEFANFSSNDSLRNVNNIAPWSAISH